MPRMMKGKLQSLMAIALFVFLAANAPVKGAPEVRGGGQYLFYVSSTGQAGKNIHAFRFDAATGQLTPIGDVAETVSPGALAVDPKGLHLYVVNEVRDYKGTKGGGVNAFGIDRKTGSLTFLNDVLSGGGNPTYVAVDNAGKNIVVSNYYFGGKIAVFPILQNGRLGEGTAFASPGDSVAPSPGQDGPHAHAVYLSPDNRFALACDMGLDKVRVYRFDSARGSLTANDPAFVSVDTGAGPRHLAFSPNSRSVYVINEHQSSISAFSFEAARGILHPLQTISTLPKDFKGQNTAAEVRVSQSGKFLYASNRGHDSIAVFAIDPRTGALTPIEDVPSQGKTPNSFAFDPTGSFLFVGNVSSDNIVGFRVDAKNGRLNPTGRALSVKVPASEVFVPLR
jgi:6-phosphogluconolactonase